MKLKERWTKVTLIAVVDGMVYHLGSYENSGKC
jgi:hypothetical protein